MEFAEWFKGRRFFALSILSQLLQGHPVRGVPRGLRRRLSILSQLLQMPNGEERATRTSSLSILSQLLPWHYHWMYFFEINVLLSILSQLLRGLRRYCEPGAGWPFNSFPVAS